MASTKIRILKILLLGLVAFTLIGVAGLYVIGKKTQFVAPRTDPAAETDPGTQQQGSGFDHTVSRDGSPLFRMRGGRDRRDQDGNLFVEEVLVTIYRESEEPLEVVADQARYNLESESAELIGNVTVAGASGLALTTEELKLLEGGRVLESTGEVDFRYGSGLVGTAGRLRSDLERELFIFQSGVEIRSPLSSERGQSLQANRVFFERGDRLIRATGNVKVRWEDSQLDADKVAATLDPFDDRLSFLRAHYNVFARIATGVADGARVTRLRGSRLGILFEGPNGSVSRIEIEDEARGRARIDSRGAMGSSVLWKTRFFKADFLQGELSSVDAVGRAELVEYMTEDPSVLIRRICSARSSARFSQGEMQQINVSTDVDLQDRRFQVLADKARMTPQSLDVTGEPVLVRGVVGQITAPQVTFAESNGLIHASGGVDVQLPPRLGNPLTGGHLSGGDEPVQITSNEGFVRPSTQSFLFQGDVKAWTGPRLLRSQLLRGDADPERLTASGGVENVWTIERSGPSGPVRTQMRVTAESLTYESSSSLATYRNAVRVYEGQRTLACDTLEVQMDEEGAVETMNCDGSVDLQAPDEGRQVQAASAKYDVGEEEVVFRGNPVVLTERTGAKLQGSILVYSTRHQTVQIRSRDNETAANQ